MMYYLRFGAARQPALIPLQAPLGIVATVPSRGWTPWLRAPLGWLAALLLLGTSAPAVAQISSPQTIPSGTYPTIASAIAALNNGVTGGVGAGGVTFNVAAGYTETMGSVAAGRLNITVNKPTGANQIIFQKSGSGANPKITAGAGGSTAVDAIISLSGTDFTTFDGIDLLDPSSNSTQTTAMEAGYALFRPAAADGCQNNTVKNCTITLNRSNIASASGVTYGIWAANVTATNGAITTNNITGANSNNKFYGNTILNTQLGIYLQGYADGTAPYTYFDQSNDIGGASTSTGNTIQNFGGVASTTTYGIRLSYQNAVNASYNTINNAANGGSASPATLNGIGQITGNYVGGTYSNNTITLTQGGHGSAVYGVNLQYTAVTASTGAVTVSNNVFAVSYSAAGSGQVNAIYLLPGGTAGTFGSETVSGNTLSGTSGSPMQINTTGSVYFIYANNATPNVTVTNNTSNYVSKTSAGGTFYGYTDSGTNPASGTATVTGNTISNITLTGATGFEGIDHRTSTNQTCTVINNTVGPVTLGTSAAYGVYSGYGTSTSTFDSNTVTSLTGGSGAVYGLYLIATSTATAASNNVTNLSSSGAVYGVYLSGSGTSTTFTRGNVNTLSTSGTSTAYGVFIASGAVTNVTRTKIYGLSASAAGGSVTGIHSAAGTTNTLTNNLIGDLTAPAATGNNAVNGVYVAGGTNTNLYYNTIDVTGSGGSSFGSSGVYVASNTPTVDMRANIIINKATAGIGGATVAYRRLNATLTTFATASNNNLLYTPCGGYLYGEGVGVPTNTQTTIASYKAYVGPTRETNAKTEDVPFLSATGSSANFLHINTGVATQVENGGVSVSGITNDYDNDARNASTPDIGADEGPFTGPANMAVVSSSYTPQSGNSSTPSMNQYTTLVTVNTTGTQNPLTVTDLTLTMGGTAASASIINAKVFAGGCSATFSTTTQALPTEVAPSGTFTLTFATPVTLLTGANTFFVTFDVASGAVNAATFSATPTVVAFSSGPSSTPTLSGSMVARTIVGPLNGTYLVGQGQTSPNYATLTAALADLQALGVNGAVTFSLTNSTFVPYNTGNGETFPLIINGTYTGAGTFPVTIKPAATKQPIISAITTTALVILNEAKNVTIDGSNTVGGTTQDLLIYDLSGATTAAVWVKSNGTGAQNNTIKNTNLAAGASQNASTSVTFGIFQGGATLGIANAGTGNNSNVFQNNYVIQARYGIFSIGNSTTPNTGTQINDNQIGPVKTIPFGLGSSGFGALEIGRAGVVVAGDNGAIITGNEVGYVGGNYANTPSGAVRAGIVLGSDAGTVSSTAISSLVYNARVASNRVHDIVEERTLSAIGIVVAGTNGGAATNNQVYSNFIYNVKANGTAGNAASGIDLLYGNGDVVAYNSINLYGALDPTAAATAAAGSAFALTIGSSANVTNPSIRNNAVAVDVTSRITTLKHGAIVTPAAYAWGTGGADRNDYYYNASNTQLWTGSVGTPSGGGTFFQTLNDWQTATSQDANSIQSDPQFTSPSDPHTFAVALDGAGRGIAGLSTDIDGDTRLTGAAQATDIGADEFSQPSVDVKPFALAAPAASSVCYTNAESVMVTIQNNSNTTALDFTAHPITVTVSVTGAVTQSFTTTINSNAGNPGGTALVSGATRDVTLPGALNMTTVGTYNFAVAATAGGSPSDQVTSNDVLATQTRTVSTPTAGTAAASPGTICGASGNVTLTATGAIGGVVTWYSSADGFSSSIGIGSPLTYTIPSAGSYSFKYKVVCATTSVFSSLTGTVSVLNPLVSTTNSPQTRCGAGTVTLTGTPSAGATLHWYDTNASTMVLASGNSYAPSVTATRQFFVSATQAGAADIAGLPSNSATYGTSTGSSTNNYSLGFDVASPGILVSVDVYPTAAGTSTIQLYTVSGAQPGAGTAVSGALVSRTFTAGEVGTKVTVPLNFVLTAGSYKVGSPTSSGLTRFTSYTGTYPLTSGVVSVVGSYTSFSSTAFTSGTYNNFFNLTYTPTCESARTTVQVNVTTSPMLTFTGTTSYCAGSTTTLTASGSYTNLVVTPSTGAVVSGNTVTFSGGAVGATAYNIAADDNTGANGCSSSAVLSIAVSPVTPAPTLSATSASICSGSSTNLTVTAPAAYANASRPALSQDFNDNPASWTVAETSTRGSARPAARLRWQRPPAPYSYSGGVTLASYSLDGSRFIIANSDTGSSGSTLRTRIISPVFSLAGYTTASLTFQQYFDWFAAGDSANVDVSTDGGTTWTLNVLQQHSADVGSSATPNTATVSLNTYVGQTDMRIRFRFKAAWGYLWAIDNVLVSGNYGETVSYSVAPATGASLSGSTITFNPTATTSYIVTAAYLSGCTSTGTPVTISVSNPSFTFAQTNVGCFGASTGSITVTASGGLGTYEYSNDNGMSWQTSNVFSGLAAGGYQVMVRDVVSMSLNCPTAAQTVTITQPAIALVLNLTPADVSCNGGANGSILAQASNGTANYQYSIDGGTTYLPVTPTASSRNFTGLAAGAYTVIARDANGCTTAQMVSVNEPAVALSFGTSKTDVTCRLAANGTITVTAAGGTAPYQYKIGAGAYVSQANPYTYTPLAPGSYQLYVKDANGCTSGPQSVTITQPALALTASRTFTNATCNSAADGTITVNANGGAPTITGYFYSLDGAMPTEHADPYTFTSVAPGTHTLDVTDANSCAATQLTVTITEPAVLAFTKTSDNVSCNGAANGDIVVTITGGTSPFHYSTDNGVTYSTPSATTPRTISGLAPGSYDVVIKDAHNCVTASQNVVIIEPTALTFTPAGTNALCFGSATGQIQVTAAGGTPFPGGQYEFRLDGGAYTQQANPYTFTGLSSGNHTIRVRDANGCVNGPQTVTIGQPAVVSSMRVVTNATCNAGTDGQIQVTGTGGTSPYVFSKDNGVTFTASPAASTTFTGVSAGTYQVQVKDANNCVSAVVSVPVGEPAVVTFSYTTTTASCLGGNGGAITVFGPSGGSNSGYQYSKDNGVTYQGSTTFSLLGTGTYQIVVKDANGCTSAPIGVFVGTTPNITWVGGATTGPNPNPKTDWYNPANWTPACVPTALNSAIIPNRVYDPVLSAGTAPVNNVTILPSGRLTLTGGTLSLAGNFSNAGIFTQTGGTVAFAGASLQNIGQAVATTFTDLVIGPGGAQLTGTVRVTGVLTLNGNLNPNGQTLTLISNAAGTGLIVNNGAAAITGPITVQRYVAGLAPEDGYRHLASPVAGAPFADLSSLGVAGFHPVVNGSYNTNPNTFTPATFPNIFGYAEDRPVSTPRTGTLATDLDNGYFSPSALTGASGTMTPGQGWSVYFPDHKGFDVTGVPGNGNTFARTGLTGSTTLTAFGSGAMKGWHLLGNPYPAPLDWDNATVGTGPGQLNTAGGMQGVIYVFQSAGGLDGVWRDRTPALGGSGSLTNGVVPMGQGFFTEVVSPVGGLSFQFSNALRLTAQPGAGLNVVNRTTTGSVPLVSLKLHQVGAAAYKYDQAFVGFETGATANFDAYYDGRKPSHNLGTVPTLVSLTGTGQELSINGLPPALLATGTVVNLLVDIRSAGDYTFTAEDFVNLPAAPNAVVLVDRQLGRRTSLAQGVVYGFHAATAGVVPGRFALEFGAQGGPTGVSAAASAAASLVVYPNPASAKGEVQVLGVPAGAAVELLDATGRLVRTAKLTATGAAVRVADLSAGVYTVRAGGLTRRLVLE